MTSNGKTLNYKVVYLVESYNFHMKFTSMLVETKQLQNFKNRLYPYSRGKVATIHPARTLPPCPTAVDV
jgi:hypothetical protein